MAGVAVRRVAGRPRGDVDPDSNGDVEQPTTALDPVEHMRPSVPPTGSRGGSWTRVLEARRRQHPVVSVPSHTGQQNQTRELSPAGCPLTLFSGRCGRRPWFAEETNDSLGARQSASVGVGPGRKSQTDLAASSPGAASSKAGLGGVKHDFRVRSRASQLVVSPSPKTDLDLSAGEIGCKAVAQLV